MQDHGPAAPDDAPPPRADAPLPVGYGYPRLAPVPSDARLAVIGTGPAGMYTLKELLARTPAHIVVIDALPTPGGLVRSGVAPDHPATKDIQRTFDIAMRHPRVTFLGGVTVGRDLSLGELRRHVDAVFVATGASAPRRLGVDGEGLACVVSAREVVAWAGGLPGHDVPPFPMAPTPTSPTTSEVPVETTGDAPGDAPDDAPDDGADDGADERVVIVGTGNVALDLARLFTLPHDALARTDVAERALTALRERHVRDVLVLGRGPASSAAYTEAEIRALPQVPGLEIRSIDADEPVPAAAFETPTARARVTFLFGAQVECFAPREGGVDVVVRRADGESLTVAAQLAVTSLGQDVVPLDGLGLDATTGAHAHDDGRVRDHEGVYVVGWAKRGARGGIGANRGCAQESVDTYLGDAMMLPRPDEGLRALRAMLDARGVVLTDRRGAGLIDRSERRAGVTAGRPRVKITTLAGLQDAARGRRRSLTGRPRRPESDHLG